MSVKLHQLIYFNLLFWGTGLPLPAQLFVDQAAVLGLIHTDRSSGPGGGVSFADFDGDGFDDLSFATGAGEPLQFYRNTPNGLEALTDPTGNLAEIKHLLWVDYDNDGDQDLFCSSYDGPIYLYRRDGDWLFTEVTEAAGLPVITKRHYGAAWGDYNRDGWLDLYYSQRRLPGQVSQSRNRLFKNNGDGTFSDVSVAAGVEDANRIPFCIGFTDYNGDHWPDLYIANDRNSRNTLFQNLQDGTFSDVSESSGAGIAIDAMNMGLADFDRDGDEDIYVTNIEEGSYLLQNTPNGFNNVAPALGVGFYGIGWGASWIDGDMDGMLDLYVSGSIVGNDAISSAYYRQQSNGSFSPINNGFVGDTVYSWSNAVGDFNRDHRPDIAVLNQWPYPSQLWQNIGETPNFLELRLQGVLSNRDGIGSKVEIFHDNHYQSAYTHCGSGFLAQQSKTIRFGLGVFTRIDSVKITWPSGHIDRLLEPASQQNLLIVEGSSTGGVITPDPAVNILLNTYATLASINADLLVFPNPATQAQAWQISPPISGKVYLYDSLGRLLARGEINQGYMQFPHHIFISAGLYQLQIIQDGKRYVKTLRIE